MRLTVDGDVDAVLVAGLLLVLLLRCVVAVVVTAAVVAVAAVVVKMSKEERTRVDVNPPMEAQAGAASSRCCLVKREPRSASQSDEIVS